MVVFKEKSRRGFQKRKIIFDFSDYKTDFTIYIWTYQVFRLRVYSLI